MQAKIDKRFCTKCINVSVFIHVATFIVCMAHVRDTTKFGLVDGAHLYRYILRLLQSDGACSIFTASETEK